MQVNKSRTALFVFLAALQVLFVGAQNSFVIKNAAVFDGEKVIENTDVAVENGFIAKVGQALQVQGLDEINGSGKFLMPALSNAHVHAWAPASLMQAAKAGVLNVFDMAGFELYQNSMTALRDSTQYAAFYRAGSPATAPEGHGTQFGFPVPTLKKPDEVGKFITDRIAAGVDYIKIIVEPWRATLDQETIIALIETAHENEMMAVSHISQVEDANFVIENNIDGLVHIWWDKKMDEAMMAKLTADKDFFVIPTLLTSVLAIEMIKKNSPDLKFLSKEELQSEAKRLYDAGVPLLAGTDPPNANINYGTDLYREMQLLAEAGIPNLDVLKSATSNIADNFDLQHKGYLKEGFVADMILIDGNPMEDMQDIGKMANVWKKGKRVNLE